MSHLVTRDFMMKYLMEHPSINNLYIRGTNIEFEHDFITIDENRGKFCIYVDTNDMIQKIRSALTMTSNINIDSIENLFQETNRLKDEIQSLKSQISDLLKIDSPEGESDTGNDPSLHPLQIEVNALKIAVSELQKNSSTPKLQGILTLEKDDQGNVGLEIPGLLSINNYEFGKSPQGIMATCGNICLMNPTAEVLQMDTPSNINTHGQNEFFDWKTIEYRSGHQGYYLIDPNFAPSGDGVEFYYNAVGDLVDLNVCDVLIPEGYLTPDTRFHCVLDLGGGNEYEFDKQIDQIHMEYQNVDSSSIHLVAPRTVDSLLLKNFSGVLDLRYCPKTVLFGIILFDVESSGTLLITQEQHDQYHRWIQDDILDNGGTIHVRIVGGNDDE